MKKGIDWDAIIGISLSLFALAILIMLGMWTLNN